MIHERVMKKGYRIMHLDTILIAQEPHLAPYFSQMRLSLAKCLGVSEEAINIKAKTNEGMGFLGRGEGIAAQAKCLDPLGSG